jgi:hypothetical protein
VSALKKTKEMKKKNIFISKLNINLRKKPDKSYIWSVALYSFETWALPKVDQKHLKVLRCSAGEGWRSAVGPIV